MRHGGAVACDSSYDQNKLQAWARVPYGSTLELSVEPDGDGVEAAARLIVDRPNGNDERQYSRNDLIPGPLRIRLVAPRVYTVRVRVGFTSSDEASAVIKARIIKPDKSVFGLPYNHCVSGTNGDAARATITVATLKSG